tara:strand:+ start:907 stop:1011 length:105 start_codon:yes stop_codon:yes gene_type:complete
MQIDITDQLMEDWLIDEIKDDIDLYIEDKWIEEE